MARVTVKLPKFDRDVIVASMRVEARMYATCADDQRAKPSERAMSHAKAQQLHELSRKIAMADTVEFTDG